MLEMIYVGGFIKLGSSRLLREMVVVVVVRDVPIVLVLKMEAGVRRMRQFLIHVLKD